MNRIKVGVITRKSEDSPGVENLKRVLDNDRLEVDYYFNGVNLGELNVRGQDFLENSFTALKHWITLSRRAPNYDVLIIHKMPVNRDWKFIVDKIREFDNTIYNTADAEFVRYDSKPGYLFSGVKKIIANSKNVYDEASKYNQNVVLIPNSVDTELFSPGEGKTTTPSKFTLGWVGNAKAHHGNLRLLSSILEESGINEEVEVKLLCAGEKKAAKKAFSGYEGSIEVIDKVERSKIPEIIREFDIALSPLVDNDFNSSRCSLKVIEYMSCGVPVIASNVGEQKRLIQDAGFAVENDADKWKNAILELKHDETKRKSMGSKGRKIAEETYSIDRVSEKLFNEILDLLD